LNKSSIFFICLSFLLTTSCFTRVDIYEKLTSAPDINIKEITAEKRIFDYNSLELFNSTFQEFTIENKGNTTLIITGVSISGQDFTQFSLNIDSMSSLVPAGGSTFFTVTFKPTRTTDKTTTIMIVSNDPDESIFEFTVTGSGLESTKSGPDIKVFIGSKEILQNEVGTDFGQITLGTKSSPATFTLENAGDYTLNIYDIFLSGEYSDQFIIDDSSTLYTLYPGNTTKLTVYFQPNTTGVKQTDLVVQSDDPDEEEYSFVLKGSGSDISLPDINIQHADTNTDIPSITGEYNFGTVEIGSPSSVIFNIQNTGTADLNLTLPITAPSGFDVTISPLHKYPVVIIQALSFDLIH